MTNIFFSSVFQLDLVIALHVMQIEKAVSLKKTKNLRLLKLKKRQKDYTSVYMLGVLITKAMCVRLLH